MSGLAGFAIAGWAILCMLASPAAAQRPLGIDVSQWQNTITWPPVYSSGRVFSFIKASQGTTFTDPRFYTNIANARAAGVLVGPYHFTDPLNKRQPADNHTAVDEANWFVSVAGNYMVAGYLPPVIDVEACSELGKTALSKWVNDFCNRVLALKGVRPIVYTNYNYATTYLDSSVTQWDLWLAYWNYGDPQTANPPSGVWPTWKFWQYTVADAGTVPGITTAIDLDVFHGTMAELLDYVIGQPGQIVLNPTSLSATVRRGRTLADQTFTVTIAGGTSLNYSVSEGADWLNVNPSGGSSSGEADTITVSYILNGLAVGTYTASITVSAPGATNTPVLLPVTLTIEPVPGDLDRDGDIDVQDVVLFKPCMTPPVYDQPYTLDPTCVPADLNGDTGVDQSDYGILQKCTSGPTIPADPECPES